MTPSPTTQVSPPIGIPQPIYLPYLGKPGNERADLLPASLLIAPEPPIERNTATVVQIVLQNQGLRPASNFWVDLYVDPIQRPSINQAWQQLCSPAWPVLTCLGAAWHVTETLQPGQAMTLSTSTQVRDLAYSHWPGYFSQEGPHTLYVQVDSYGDAQLAGQQGQIDEQDEQNNVLGPVGFLVTVNNSSTALPPLAPSPAASANAAPNALSPRVGPFSSSQPPLRATPTPVRG